MGRKVISGYDTYIKSEVWKCLDSPTGAHYWVQMVETIKLVKGGYFRCKHCSDVKRFPLTINAPTRKVSTTLEKEKIKEHE